MYTVYKRIYNVILVAAMVLGLWVAPALAQSAGGVLTLKAVIVDQATNDVVTPNTKNVALWVYVKNNTPSTITLPSVVAFQPWNLYPLNSSASYSFNINNLNGVQYLNAKSYAPGETEHYLLGTLPVSKLRAGFYFSELTLTNTAGFLTYGYGSESLHVGTAISAELY